MNSTTWGWHFYSVLQILCSNYDKSLATFNTIFPTHPYLFCSTLHSVLLLPLPGSEAGCLWEAANTQHPHSGSPPGLHSALRQNAVLPWSSTPHTGLLTCVTFQWIQSPCLIQIGLLSCVYVLRVCRTETYSLLFFIFYFWDQGFGKSLNCPG